MAGSSDPDALEPVLDTDREALLQTLVEHGVQFVLIGGAAIQSYGRRYDTKDVDVVPDTRRPTLLCSRPH